MIFWLMDVVFNRAKQLEKIHLSSFSYVIQLVLTAQ